MLPVLRPRFSRLLAFLLGAVVVLGGLAATWVLYRATLQEEQEDQRATLAVRAESVALHLEAQLRGARAAVAALEGAHRREDLPDAGSVVVDVHGHTLDAAQRGGEPVDVRRFDREQVEGDPLCAFGPDTGQLAQFVDQVLDGTFKHLTTPEAVGPPWRPPAPGSPWRLPATSPRRRRERRRADPAASPHRWGRPPADRSGSRPPDPGR